MQKIVSTLKSIISLVEIDTIADDTNEKKETHSLEKYKTNSELSKETIDLNNELMSNNELLNVIEYKIISEPNKRIEELNNELLVPNEELNIIEDENGVSSQSQKYENSLSCTSSDQVSIDFIEFLDVDKLIAFIVEKHDKGMTFDQVEQFISKQILQINQVTNQIIKWLLKNQDKSQYIWFLGLFYYYNISIEENVTKAFELFSKAANDNYSIAQVYLAKCYYDGCGINCNRNMTFHWYKKSTENGSVI